MRFSLEQTTNSSLVTRRSLIASGLMLGVAATGGRVWWTFRRAPQARVLSQDELDVVTALSEVLFPGAPMPLSGLQAGVPMEVDRIVAEVFDTLRATGFRAALKVLQLGTVATWGKTFSKLNMDERRQVLTVWADPDIIPRRIALDGFNAVLGMAYWQHPTIIEHLGWKVCSP